MFESRSRAIDHTHPRAQAEISASKIFFFKKGNNIVSGLNSGLRSISNLSSVIVRETVDLKRTVGDSD